MAIEVVKTESGWFIRKRDSANGETLWHSEVYESRQSATEAAEREAGDEDINYVEDSE